jgi:hypothetical protein
VFAYCSVSERMAGRQALPAPDGGRAMRLKRRVVADGMNKSDHAGDPEEISKEELGSGPVLVFTLGKSSKIFIDSR